MNGFPSRVAAGAPRPPWSAAISSPCPWWD